MLIHHSQRMVGYKMLFSNGLNLKCYIIGMTLSTQCFFIKFYNFRILITFDHVCDDFLAVVKTGLVCIMHSSLLSMDC